MSTMIPMDGRVLIKRDDAKGKSTGGILLPDNAKERLNTGRVLSVGLGKLMENGERAPVVLKDGDRVLFGTYAGSEIEFEGQIMVVANQDEILAKIV